MTMDWRGRPTRGALQLACVSLFALVASGCGTELATAEHSAQQAVSGSHFYLRCGATGDGADAHTRLRPRPDAPDLRELTFDVNDARFVDGADACVVSETPVEDGFGAWKTNYRNTNRNVIEDAPLRFLLTPMTADDVRRPLRLRYPARGRYRATLDVEAHALTIERVDAPRPGDVTWRARGASFVDAAGRLLVAAEGPSQLARVDLERDFVLWTRGDAELFYGYRLSEACADPGDAFLSLYGRVELFSIEDGASRWQKDFGVDADYAATSFWCIPDSDRIYGHYRVGAQWFLEALSRATGEAAWTVESEGAGVRGANEDVVVLEAPSRGVGGARVLDARTGVERPGDASPWPAGRAPAHATVALLEPAFPQPLESVMEPIVIDIPQSVRAMIPNAQLVGDGNGRAYLVGGTVVARIARRTGQVLWRFDAARAPGFHRGDSVYLVRGAFVSDEGAVYVNVHRPWMGYDAPPSSLHALDAATGAARWSHAERMPQTILRSSGDRLVVQAGDDYLFETFALAK
jgi:outer membrane protein assembly factor BamB